MPPRPIISRAIAAGLPALAVAVLLVGAGCPRQTTTETAAQEVVVYCSVDEDVAAPIFKDFEKSSGLKIVPRFDKESGKTTVLIQKLTAEASRPVADVYWGGEVFHTIHLAQAGLLEPYEPVLAKAWPQGMADPAGSGTVSGCGPASRVQHAAGDRGRGARATRRPPGPEVEGPDRHGPPEFGTNSGHVASWYAWYGEERATEILRGLRANEIRIVASNSLAVQDVASGKADICMTDTDDVYAAQREKWPVGLKVSGTAPRRAGDPVHGGLDQRRSAPGGGPAADGPVAGGRHGTGLRQERPQVLAGTRGRAAGVPGDTGPRPAPGGGLRQGGRVPAAAI